MRRGYIDPRRKEPNILGVLGWVVAFLVSAAFAWFAFFGPGSTRAPAAPTAVPTAEPTETVAPAFSTSVPTDAPPPTATAAPPTNTPPPLPTTIPTLAPTPQFTMTVGAEGANVRKGPGTYYEQLGRLEAGASAVVTGRYDRWLRIEFEGAEGWVANWIVTVSDLDGVPQVEPPDAEQTAVAQTEEATEEATAEPTVEPTVAAPTATAEATGPVSPTLTAGVDGANVRTGPGTLFEQVGRLEPGATAVITGRYDRWFQIDFNGTTAWVANWVVTATGAENVPEVEPPAPSPTPEITPTEEAAT